MSDPVEKLPVEEEFRPEYRKLDSVRTPAVEDHKFRRAVDILNPAEVLAGADEFRNVLEVLDQIRSLAVRDECGYTFGMLDLGTMFAVEDEFM